MLFGRSESHSPSRRVLHFLRDLVRRNNSLLPGKLGIWMLTIWFNTKGTVPPGSLRAIASTLQPLDPLRRARFLPTIDVMVPFIVKDLPTLQLCVKGILDTVRNPIGRIRLITPDYYDDDQNRRAIDQVLARLRVLLPPGLKIQLESDDQVLGSDFHRLLRDRGHGQPGGWHKQQLVKFFASRNTSALATLVVDADTVLLESRTWFLGDGTQLLQFSEAFQPGYKQHFQEFFEESGPAPFSFVTHHQLMSADTLREMFPSPTSIIDWFITSRTIPGPGLSEYEAYGSFMWARHRDKVVLGAWANLWSPKREKLCQFMESNSISIRDAIPDYCSVSFHAHAQQ